MTTKAAKKDARQRAVYYRGLNKKLPPKMSRKVWKVRQIQRIPAGPRLVQVINDIIAGMRI